MNKTMKKDYLSLDTPCYILDEDKIIKKYNDLVEA